MRKKLAIISPSSYSQVMPMLELSKSLKEYGFDITFCVSNDFKEQVLSNNLKFYELNFKKIVNTGVAQKSLGSIEEKKRLNDFFNSTKEGALETLIFQTLQRQKDLLSDPFYVMGKIKELINIIVPDLFIINHLNFAITLSMYCLKLNYLSFVPGHPSQLPEINSIYGVPKLWPSEIEFDQNLYNSLKFNAMKVENLFTEVFNNTINTIDPSIKPINNAFKLTSQHLVIFNYPDFKNTHSDILNKCFLEHSFKEEDLDLEWQKIINNNSQSFKILLSFGTFLSARVDVLERCIRIINQNFPNVFLMVSAGENKLELDKYSSDKVVIREFLPQISILKNIDLVIHHGGGNTFTESLFYSKPMILMPFSTDQFMIANDVKLNKIGDILDPNHFTDQELINSINKFLVKVLHVDDRLNKIKNREDSINMIAEVINKIK